MESNWATEHLQVIRTLMERAALYRRALAPVMLWTGAVGLLAALAGWQMGVQSPRSFAGYWLAVALVAAAAAFVLVRREALKEREPFWSPPTRRVAHALVPALAAGLLLTVAVFFGPRFAPLERSLTLYAAHLVAFVWLPAAWIVLYGCAIHAAGFFMPRGMKLFGWSFILGGSGLFWVKFADPPTSGLGYAVMALFFGVLHLAYGTYLYFTEQTRKAA